MSLQAFRCCKASVATIKQVTFYVKTMLWHTPKNGALLHTQLIRFEGNKFEIKIAQAKQEIVKLLEAGF